MRTITVLCLILIGLASTPASVRVLASSIKLYRDRHADSKRPAALHHNAHAAGKTASSANSNRAPLRPDYVPAGRSAGIT